jgi:hypothetical protein
MGLMKFGRRLFHDTGGQFLMFAAILVVVIIAFLLAIPNGTQVTTQKMRSQTAADAGAFTGSVWLSRSLNLSANMNIGIKSVYTWMTVLTMGEALAKALYSDTLDSSVHALGGNITLALFGSSNPLTVHSVEYPGSIRKLDTTALWLYALQEDIAESFHEVAATLGSEEASRNAGAYPATQTAGGWTIVRTNDTIPLLVNSTVGDSLLYADLLTLGPALDTIPTMDPNITPATGRIIIDPNTWDIRAYYDDTSLWMDRTDSLYHPYQKPIIQVFQHGTTIDSGVQYFEKPGGGSYSAYLHGDSWAMWLDRCHEGGTHTPFIWVDGTYKNTAYWTLVNCHPGNNRYKLDTCWTTQHLAKRDDTSSMNDVYPPGESAWIRDHGDTSLSHYWIPTGFYTGAESTDSIKGARVRPRRVNPDRVFHATSYVWRHGATSAPYGLGPPMGGALFPRGAVAAASPLFSVARSEPFMPLSTASGYEYYFTPAWDVKLTPLDSIGVVEITSDTGFPVHSRNSFNNLEDLRKYVLLP